MSPQQILTTVMTCIIVDKGTDNTRPHSICFFIIISTNEENVFLQSAS